MRFYIVAIAIAGMMTITSCAKRETVDNNSLEQLALDAWVEKYVKSPVTGRGIDVVRQSNGMWVEFIEDGNQTIDSARDTTVWVMLHYTSTDIAGNVFATRDSIEALRQRTYTPYTYYSPEYLYCDEANNYNLPEFQHFALRNDLVKPDGSKMKLSEGSHVKLYIPSFLAYGSKTYTNDQGYGGQFPLGSTRIVIHDLTVKRVVKNPLTYEEDIVKRFAMERWGKAETDTLAPCFWLDTINFHPRADLLEQFPNKPLVDENGDSNRYGLTADSTARFWFVGRFLPTPEYPDGFIFDTNIPLVHEEFYDRRKSQNYPSKETNLSAISYRPADDSEEKMSVIAAFYRAIPTLRKGQWSRIVFPSSYGYGATGQSKALQDFQKEQAETLNMLSMYSMYSNYGYGGGYGGYGGYGYGYGDYGYYGGGGYGYGYDPYSPYLDYSMSGYSQEEEEQIIVTEIPPFTPLMFEIYIEAPEDEEEE